MIKGDKKAEWQEYMYFGSKWEPGGVYSVLNLLHARKVNFIDQLTQIYHPIHLCSN